MIKKAAALDKRDKPAVCERQAEQLGKVDAIAGVRRPRAMTMMLSPSIWLCVYTYAAQLKF